VKIAANKTMSGSASERRTTGCRGGGAGWATGVAAMRCSRMWRLWTAVSKLRAAAL